MPTKIETSLTPEQLMEFFRRCAQTKGGAHGPAIQALAAEFGVTISHESANTFRKGALKEYLEELAASARLAEDVSTLAKAGAGMADGAAAAFGAKVFDAARKIQTEEIGTEKANMVSLAISRLRSGDQRAKYLEAKVAEIQQQIEKLQREKQAWQEKQEKAKAAIATAAKKGGITADTRKILEKALTEEVA